VSSNVQIFSMMRPWITASASSRRSSRCSKSSSRKKALPNERSHEPDLPKRLTVQHADSKARFVRPDHCVNPLVAWCTQRKATLLKGGFRADRGPVRIRTTEHAREKLRVPGDTFFDSRLLRSKVRSVVGVLWTLRSERTSADKAMRMPLSKQRNKHIQRPLVEAAKLAPRQSHELAMIYDGERQKGNSNRATLAVGPKDGRVSACRGSATERLRACGRTQDCGSISTAEINRMNKMRRLPGPACCRLSEGDQTLRGSLRIVSGLAENTNSIFCDGPPRPETANGCLVLPGAGTDAERHTVRHRTSWNSRFARSRERARDTRGSA
jgi:hypothetical protein